MKARLTGKFLILALVLAPVAAFAQAWPAKPVRIVLPVTSGGLQDTLTRAIASEIGKRWGQPVIVESRAGANGIIASEHVVRSAPDGYTILMTSHIQVSNDLLPEGRGLSFDPVRDFMPVIGLVSTGNILVAKPEFPASTLAELIALARDKPGGLNYGSWGTGSSPHIDTETLARIAGLKMTHIPYKGSGPLLQALLGGQVHFTIAGLPPALALIRQGRLKPIAYGGRERSSILPDVPTFSESGFKNLDSGGWFGWLVPAATPKAVVDRIAADASAVITTPAFRDKHITGVGMEVLNLSSAAFVERFKTDRESYAARLRGLETRRF